MSDDAMDVIREGEANWPQQDWLLGAPADPEASPAFNLVSILRIPPARLVPDCGPVARLASRSA